VLICGQKFSDDLVKRLQETIDGEPGLSRVKLSRRVCEWLEWRNSNGELKEMSCRVALLKMHRSGMIHLPRAGAKPGRRRQKRRGSAPCERPPTIRGSLSEMGPIELIRINSADSRASHRWNELMDKYHYLGSGPLCGAQVRYLIQSPGHGALGGLAFSGAAWGVGARDRWIGWDPWTRRHGLGKVVCNSRFLILPWVKVPHLASHVLSIGVRRLAKDWLERYGYKPVLVETFVEKGKFKGTSYRAANWVHVGATCGRGRQDGKNKWAVPVKDVYVYALRRDARKKLCIGPPKPVPERREGAVGDWAEEELGAVTLSDERLRDRFLVIARDLYDRPQASLPEACQTRAKTKAAYRFLDHKETTLETLLAPHYESTLSRAQPEKVVLAAQDTTSLNYSAHPTTMGLGPIGSRREGAVGLEVHDTMVFNVAGTPLGLVNVQCWARDPKEFGKKHRRYERPLKEKESYKWFVSFEAVAEAQKRTPETMWVSVGDREADIYELFKRALREGKGPKLLVRAEQDRLLADGQGHLWEKMKEEPKAEKVHVVRVTRRGNRPAREAHLEVRWAKVRLKPPQRKSHLGELSVWAVLAEEIDAPGGQEPLKWMLLTTLDVNSFEDATRVLSWYAGRWGIEVYHRTLKSGCKIEQRPLANADRIEACLAIDMVVAWRIFHLTKLGRETPEVPCSVFFEEAEWKALYSYVHQEPIPPKEPPSLREAVRMVAGLGGFLGRKGDGDPGTKSIWLGLQRLDDLTAMWKFLIHHFAPHFFTPPVSSNPSYG